MNNNEKLDYYVETFRKDPLYRTIQSNDESWLNELFTDPIYYDKVTLENTYSTKQAAELLGIPGKEQTLLNYINRNDCSWYLDVSRQTRFYRFDWKSLFKFKMILFLNNKGYTPMNIAGEIGTKLVVSSVNNEESYTQIGRGVVKGKNDLLEASIENSKIMLESLRSLEAHNDIKVKLQLERLEIEQTLIRAEEEIETLEARIDDMNDYVELFKSNRSFNSHNNEGLFSRLFPKKNNTKQQETEFYERIKKLDEKVVKMTFEKEKVINSLKEMKIDKESVEEQLTNISERSLDYGKLLNGNEKERTGNVD